MKKNKISVAIWMVTYNHEAYIAQAIESVMMQETGFKYKLFIGEDCSTDKTREICTVLKDKYPNKIKLLLNDKNIGAKKNALQVYEACFESGAKYIAMCEGDDYWTDPFKLQKQVGFLEKNKNVVICGHSISVTFDNKGSELWEVDEKHLTFRDLIKRNKLFTVSVVFRNVIKKIPDWYVSLPSGDWPLYLLLLKDKGKGYLMNEVMATYRRHKNGIWSSQSEEEIHKKVIFAYRKFLKIFKNNKYDIKLATVKYKLKYNLFFKDYSIYIFWDLVILFKMFLKKTTNNCKIFNQKI